MSGEVGVGTTGVLYSEVFRIGWFREVRFDVSADFEVVEVIGRSVRIKVGEVYGISRSERSRVRALLEGWHKTDKLFA